MCRGCGRVFPSVDLYLCDGCVKTRQEYVDAVNRAAGSGMVGMDSGMFRNRDLDQASLDTASKRRATHE